MTRKKKKTLNMGSRQKKAYSALNKRLAMYTDLVRGIIEDFAGEASRSAQSTGYTKGEKPFAFSDYPETRHAVTRMKQNFVNNMSSIIYNGVNQEWRESNLYQDMLVEDFIRETNVVIDGQKRSHYYETDNGALKAFRRRQDKGLKLSTNIWNQAKDMQTELEATLSCAIEKGMDAVTLSKRVSKYLEDYDKIKKDYKELYGKAVDIHDCEYRSMRLARSEINMAYRSAENARWQDMDFVIGMQIKTSNNHSDIHTDVCDELAGKYPKDFDWVGWHPNCRCFKIPILKKPSEAFDEDGESKPSPDEVKDMPDNFKKWVRSNEKRILAARDHGTEPYFIRDNRRKVNEVIGVKEGRHAGNTSVNKSHLSKEERDYKELNKYKIKMTPEQINDAEEIAQNFGGKLKEPMSFESADRKHANSADDNTKPYKENCQTCVVAFEARLRGLDVYALGYDKLNEFQVELANNPAMAFFKDPERKIPQIVTKLDNPENVTRFFQNEVAKNGRYQLGVRYSERIIKKNHMDSEDGHIISVIMKDGTPYCVDPQSGDLTTLEQLLFNAEVSVNAPAQIMRVDNAFLSNKITEILAYNF